MKFLILFGTHKSQMLCQNFLSSTCAASDPSSLTSCFKNQYTDLQYCPLCVHGQNSMSSAGCLNNEIFLMSSTSLGTNRPSITSSFHVRVSSLISTSTVASSHPSKIGDDTRVGCLIGSHVCCQI